MHFVKLTLSDIYTSIAPHPATPLLLLVGIFYVGKK